MFVWTPMMSMRSIPRSRVDAVDLLPAARDDIAIFDIDGAVLLVPGFVRMGFPGVRAAIGVMDREWRIFTVSRVWGLRSGRGEHPFTLFLVRVEFDRIRWRVDNEPTTIPDRVSFRPRAGAGVNVAIGNSPSWPTSFRS